MTRSRETSAEDTGQDVDRKSTSISGSSCVARPEVEVDGGGGVLTRLVITCCRATTPRCDGATIASAPRPGRAYPAGPGRAGRHDPISSEADVLMERRRGHTVFVIHQRNRDDSVGVDIICIDCRRATI